MISFKQISKRFGSQEVLKNASFHVGVGERMGVVGPNGAGKSTIFSLICGEMSSDGGTVETPKNARIGHLHQQFNPHTVDATIREYVESGRPDLTTMHDRIERLEEGLYGDGGGDRDEILEEVGELQHEFEASGGYQMTARAEAALHGLGFTEQDLSKQFRKFSGGWQMRAELARVLVADPDILLLDEPTNYLDIPAIEWLQKYLRGFTGMMVLISHDRYLLNTLTNVTVEIANAEATRYQGNYDYYVTDRVARYEQRLAAFKNQDRERVRLQRFIDRFRSKNTKAAQVQSKMKMLEKMDEITLPAAVISPGKMRLKGPVRAGQEIVRLEGGGHTYDGETWVLKGVDLNVQRGEKVALVGLNGMGKTTLLRILAGKIQASEGKLVIGHKVHIGYQSQEFAETMDPDKSVYETIRLVGSGATEQQVRTLLGGFGFSGESVDKKVTVLSGGEKVRLAFARLLVDPPNFLILDEPTTHLDVTAREALEVALREFEGTICIVSHDIEFVRNVATSIIAMRPPGVERYHGGYDYYCEKVAEDSGVVVPKRTEPATPGLSKKERRKERAEMTQKLSHRKRHLRKQANQAESRIETLEREQSELAAMLEKGDDGTDYEAINKRLGEIHGDLVLVNSLWEQAALEMERINRDGVDAL